MSAFTYLWFKSNKLIEAEMQKTVSSSLAKSIQINTANFTRKLDKLLTLEMTIQRSAFYTSKVIKGDENNLRKAFLSE